MKITIAFCFVSLSVISVPFLPQFQTAQRTDSSKLAECSNVEGADGIVVSDAKQRNSFLTATGRCMSAQDSNISALTLAEDKGVIERSYPTVRAFYRSRKYSDSDVAKILALAWTEFRRKNPSKQMSGAAFVQLGNSFGQLIVKSEPAGAAITVDARPWEGPTNNSDWTDSGQRVVKLLKQGCQPAEGNVDVLAGGSATFERKLTCP
ncbi:MAG: hypothetical protein WA192_00665 [Candidatus Acidiferrales bacterium]